MSPVYASVARVTAAYAAASAVGCLAGGSRANNGPSAIIAIQTEETGLSTCFVPLGEPVAASRVVKTAPIASEAATAAPSCKASCPSSSQHCLISTKSATPCARSAATATSKAPASSAACSDCRTFADIRLYAFTLSASPRSSTTPRSNNSFSSSTTPSAARCSSAQAACARAASIAACRQKVRSKSLLVLENLIKRCSTRQQLICAAPHAGCARMASTTALMRSAVRAASSAMHPVTEHDSCRSSASQCAATSTALVPGRRSAAAASAKYTRRSATASKAGESTVATAGAAAAVWPSGCAGNSPALRSVLSR
jgi:hypothetical protein